MLKYIVKGLSAAQEKHAASGAGDGGSGEGPTEDLPALLKYLEAVHTVKHSQDDQQVARLIEQFSLVREHVPTGLHNSAEVRTFFILM